MFVSVYLVLSLLLVALFFSPRYFFLLCSFLVHYLCWRCGCHLYSLKATWLELSHYFVFWECMARTLEPCTVASFASVGKVLYLYIRMELCQPHTLKDWLDRHRECRPAEECVAILKEVVTAVDYLHEQNCMHRDVKVFHHTTRVGTGPAQGCSGAGTRWNAVPSDILEPERRSGKYRWPQVER